MKKRTAFAWNVVRLFLCRRAFGPPATDTEGGAAAAGRHRIGIVDDELSAAQVVLEVDLGADEVLVAHGIDEKRHTALFHHGVVGVLDLVERKAVLYRACGIDGIHLYALNKYEDVAYIAKEAGLIDLV